MVVLVEGFWGEGKLLTEPVVNPEIRGDVPDEEVGPAEVLANLIQSSADNEQTQITQHNEVRVLGIIQRAARVEVVDTTEETILVALAAAVALTLMLVVTGDVGQEVCGPATELLIEQVERSGQRSLLSQLIQLMDHLADSGSIGLTSLGNKDHVALHMTGGLVVLAVGDFPGEVRNHQQRVADPADGVVQYLAGGERLVAALVSQNPQTSAKQTLHKGVCGPETSSYGRGGNVLRGDEVVGEVEDGGQGDHVADDIIQTGGGRPLEAVLGNGLVDISDGVVWDLEGVAIRVD